MADFNQINQFGSLKPARSGEGMSCAECEAMVTDAIDGTLSAKDRAAFDLHLSTCAECNQILLDAQRGAALLEMLKMPRPEPSPMLLDRILFQTSGAAVPVAGKIATEEVSGAAGFAIADMQAARVAASVPRGGFDLVPIPVGLVSGNVLQFRRSAASFNAGSLVRTMMQPRLAMTAAMAFFSIALTMNLTGVHVSELKASDLKPSSLRRTFYQADASLVRYYDNLRVVYELESRVRDLKQSNESDNPPAVKSSGKEGTREGTSDGTSGGGSQPQKKSPKAGSGTSERRSPLPREFKLAAEHLGTMADHRRELATTISPDLPVFTDKLKEASQEGGLV